MKGENMAQADEHFSELEIKSFNAKHKRLRGSNDLKYPPRESSCKNECGIPEHDVSMNREGKEMMRRQHRCFLAAGHEGACEFSSACGVKERVPKVAA